MEDVVFVLQKRLLKFYNQEAADENKFLDVLIQLHQQMAKMEENNSLEPKSSKSIEDLLRHLLKTVGVAGHEPQDKAVKTAPQRDIKSLGVTAPMLKNSKVEPDLAEKRMNSHRDSLARLHEPTSIGKIIKQFNHDN